MTRRQGHTPRSSTARAQVEQAPTAVAGSAAVGSAAAGQIDGWPFFSEAELVRMIAGIRMCLVRMPAATSERAQARIAIARARHPFN